MSQLMSERVDWSTWAANAEAIDCPACGHHFQPNHPRRRFCGRSPDLCPGRQRRRNSETGAATRPAARATRQRPVARATSSALAGLLADATLELHRREFASDTAAAIEAAAIDVVHAIRAPSPAAERAATVRLLAAAAARAVHLQKGTPS